MTDDTDHGPDARSPAERARHLAFMRTAAWSAASAGGVRAEPGGGVVVVITPTEGGGLHLGMHRAEEVLRDQDLGPVSLSQAKEEAWRAFAELPAPPASGDDPRP